MNGKWKGKPDMTDCVSPWMEDIKEMVSSELSVLTLAKNNNVGG